jgi:DNA topoisomerase IA
MSIVILTEKKDQAKKLAGAMGWKDGRGCFEGKFDGKDVKVVWARGHLVTLQSPDEVRPGLSWDDPAALIPIPNEYPLKINDDIPGAPPAAQPKYYIDNIRSSMKGATEFIIATDSDREGEAIGWMVLDYLGFKGKIRRAWFAAGLDTKSLKESMASLREPHITKSWYRASESRARSDWSYMLLVRAYTYYAQYQMFGNNLGTGSGRERVMSVGRVQTPALAMIVKRDREINDFQAKDHYKISGDFVFQTSSEPLNATFKPKVTRELIDSAPEGVSWELAKGNNEDSLEKPLFIDKKLVDSFSERLMAAKANAVVSRYEEKNRSDNPPKTFSLTEAQSEIAGACKISANLAQVILEDLYEQGWTSYARTSKSDIPLNFYEPDERNGLIDSVLLLPSVQKQGQEAKDIHNGKHDKYPAFVPSCFTEKPLEHHGIVPTHQVMTPKAFTTLSPSKKNEKGKIVHTTEQMQKAYEIVARQFIQALYPATKFTLQEIDIAVPAKDILGNEKSEFSTTGKILVDAGWRSAFGVGLDSFTGVPSLTTNMPSELKKVNLSPAKTSPPKRYTEITFPKAMENVGKDVADPKLRKRLKDSEGIGTPATRKNIIDTLLARGYVEVKKGAYYSTPKGSDLIDSVPSWMSSPEQTALWEDYLVKICGEQDDSKAIAMRDEFVNKQNLRVEKLIADMNTTLMPEASKRVRTTATPKKVSLKMKEAIRRISEAKNISVPKGALTNPAIAKEFLDKYAGGGSSDGKPSDKQLQLLDKIIAILPEGEAIPDDVRTVRKSCSDFIDKNIGKIPSKPPTDKAKALAEKLIEELPSGNKAPSNVLTDASICSKFINERLAASKKKGGKK